MKRLVVGATVTGATVMGAVLLWNFRGAAALFVISLAVAATLRPLVRGLEPWLGRTVALVVVYATGVVLAGMFAYVVTHGVLQEVDDGLENLRSGYDRLREVGAGNRVYGFIVKRLPSSAAVYRAVGGAGPTALVDGVLGFTLNAVDLAGRFVVVVALSAYWSAGREPFQRLWLSFVPPSGRARAREVWRSVEEAVGAHLRSELGQSLLAVLLIGLVFRLAHLPTPMLPALAAGLFRLVPFFGPLIAVVASYLAGAEVSVATGALAGTYTLLALVLLDRGLARGLYAARRYSPTLTVFLVVALVDAYGVLGVLIASPLAAAIQVLAERLLATHPRHQPHARSLAEIETRIGRARQRLPLVPPPAAAQLGNVVDRLDHLTLEAREAIEPRDGGG
jgi:predicted PurR-regulated permease PerM